MGKAGVGGDMQAGLVLARVAEDKQLRATADLSNAPLAMKLREASLKMTTYLLINCLTRKQILVRPGSMISCQ